MRRVQNASLLIYIRRKVFIFHRFPSYRREPFIISPAALYSAVTLFRGWEIAFPLVDECSRWYTIEVAHIRGGKKQTDNGPRDFDSNRINRCRGTILPQRRVTCSTRQAIGIPLSLPPGWSQWGSIDTPSIPMEYLHASNVNVSIVCPFAFNICVLQENRAGDDILVPCPWRRSLLVLENYQKC